MKVLRSPYIENMVFEDGPKVGHGWMPREELSSVVEALDLSDIVVERRVVPAPGSPGEWISSVTLRQVGRALNEPDLLVMCMHAVGESAPHCRQAADTCSRLLAVRMIEAIMASGRFMAYERPARPHARSVHGRVSRASRHRRLPGGRGSA